MKRWPTEYQALANHFNDMNYHTELLIDAIYEKQDGLRKAQLKQLQAQINPHFLYNSFFLLRSTIIAGDYSQAEQFLTYLGNYYRYITNNISEDVALREEFDHARDYLAIQAIRFEDLLELDIQPLPLLLENISIPRLILQPLYENVLVHGTWQDGCIRRIRLTIEDKNDLVLLRIGDNGENITDELIDNVRQTLTNDIPYEFTSGLTNIHHRLSLLGNGSGLDVCRSQLGGFEVIIRITKEKKSHMMPVWRSRSQCIYRGRSSRLEQ